MSCLDTELAGGAKNDIGVRIMYMFNLEKATLSEQKVEDHSWVCTIYCKNLFIYIFNLQTIFS